MKTTLSRIRVVCIPVALVTLMLNGCASQGIHPGAAGEDEPSDDAGVSSGRSANPVALGPGSGSRTASRQATDTDHPDDLWERVREGQRLEIPDHPWVRKELRWLEDNPSFLEHATQRAEPFLHLIVEEAERRALPLELVLIPAIESGFDPGARSPTQAAGLWQFVSATGRAFGLKQTRWYEGRCDVSASTRAALDYLRDLEDQFQGDWELTLAAYNAGPGAVRRAVRKNREEDLPTDFWSLDLPPETRRYVPRLLAIAEVVREPEAYGIELTPIPNRPQVVELEVPGRTDLNLVASLADIDLEELRRLNPGMLRSVTDPSGVHTLLVPMPVADTLADRLEHMDPPRRVGASYRVRAGDTLSEIAQRFDTSVTDLMEINGLAGTHIRAGQQLRVPPSGVGGSPVSTASAEPPGQLESSRPRPLKIHVVQPGDTLWDIARAHKVNHRSLAKWNGLSTRDTLHPGQTLHVGAVAPGSGAEPYSYRVESGDSLYRIARRFGVTVENIRRWNSLTGHHLRPGQVLKLYLREQVTTTL
jgi:membrane-bound lytic murein transglycosylase D